MSQLRRALLVSAIISITSAIVSAHVDTVFTISENGTLKEVPEKYQPAKLIFDASSSPPKATIEISGFSVSLPPCLSRLFILPEGEKIRAAGSWYHSRSVLPPYLHLELPQKTKPGDASSFEGYSLLFNLEDAELIDVHEWKFLGTGSVGSRVEISSICSESDQESMKPRPAA